MNWLTETFKPYAATKGVRLLKDDILFIEKHIANMPQSCHKRVLRAYLQAWLNGEGEATNVANKENLGRKSANLFLRDLLEG